MEGKWARIDEEMTERLEASAEYVLHKLLFLLIVIGPMRAA